MKTLKCLVLALVLVFFALITGCSSGGSSGKSVSGGTGTSSSTTLAQTVMVGGLGDWQWAESDFGALVPCGGNQETFQNCYQSNFVSLCNSGCTPGPFQQASPGKLRVVLFYGTEDALNICNGRGQYPSDGLQESVQAIQVLYKMQVWLATIPPIVDKNGNLICVAAVAAVNQEIETVAKGQNATVVNLGGAMTAPSDYDLTNRVSDVYGYEYFLPSATGYAAMQSAYEAVKQ
jgi:hypothetical protein